MLGIYTTRKRTLALAGVLCMCGWGGGSADAQQSGLVVGSFQPPSECSAAPGDEVVFEVEASAPTTPTYRWTADGILRPESGSSLFLQTGNAAGVHTVLVEVTAGSATTTLHWRLNVASGQPNRPPLIAAALPQGQVQAVRGTGVHFLLLASDPDAVDRVSYRWLVNGVQQPQTGSSFHLSTGSLLLGTHKVEGVASDGNNHQSLPSHAWDLTLSTSSTQNQPPVITSLSPELGPAVTDTTILTLMVEAEDPEGDPLTYRWSVDGATRRGKGNRKKPVATSPSFQFDARSVQLGLHTVRLVVADGRDNGSATEPGYSWIINVKDSSPVEEPPPEVPPDLPPPCTRGNVDDDVEEPCRGQLLVDGARMAYYRTYSLDAPDPRVTRAVIVVHGGGGNAPGYFRRVGKAADSLGITETTLIAAPDYQEGSASNSGELFWGSGDWREGANGRTSSGTRVSSYRVLDRMVEMLADRRNFPNLRSLVVTGHSAGGQVTQRYAITARFTPAVPGLLVRYVPANPSSYAYVTAERFIPGVGWTTSGSAFNNCSGWNDWKYGLEGRSSVPYVATLSDSALRTQYSARSVIYLLGLNDTDPNHDGLDTDCEAMLQGQHRLERGRRIFEHVQRTLPGNAHRKVEVRGVEHDGEAMFNSSEGKAALFP